MKFTPIRPVDCQGLKKYFLNQQYELCAYSLSCMLVWSNDCYQSCGAIQDGALIICVRFKNSAKKPYLILPVSPGMEYTPKQLAELAAKAKIPRYWFVPQDYLARHGRKRVEALFSVRAHKEFHDYVYMAHDLAALKGNRYSKKRNLISQFARQYVTGNRVEIARISAFNNTWCLDFLENWYKDRTCGIATNKDFLCEKQAAQNALENWDLLDFDGILVLVDKKVSAFAIGSRLTNNMGVLNFEKALASIKGLYQFLDRECASRVFGRYAYVNKESDMSLPGLARAKRSYHPVRKVLSYKLTLK